MNARIGDKKQREKTLKMVKEAGMDVKVTLKGALVRAYDGGILVVSITAVKKDLYAFRYNPAYWNGL